MQGSTPFWSIEIHGQAPALIEDSVVWSHAALACRADALTAELPSGAARSLGFVLLDASSSLIAAYLGCLRSHDHVPLLLQPDIHPELLERLTARFEPEWIVAPAGSELPAGYRAIPSRERVALFARELAREQPPIHPDLALLLSTSGSTGSQKLVRLSYEAIASNAEAIVAYLELTSGDRAITTLPLAYSFGMSILNSHFAAGGSLVLTHETPMSRDFWALAAEARITSLSGVPSSFEMLRRAGIEKRQLESLRMLTQAGGRLRPETTAYFEALARAQGWRFFVMYGQTEAAPRIAYVPPERLGEKIGSIGIAVPGGALDIDPESSELVYCGSNVMMGYAETRQELARGDECGGVLRTGDLATRDADGFFTITGRLKRFVKLSGARVNLDEVENQLGAALSSSVACTGQDEVLIVWLSGDIAADDAEVSSRLRELFKIHPSLARIRRISRLPLMSNGKIDYRALAENEAIG